MAEAPPAFGPEFLQWLKVETERAWKQAEEMKADFQRARSSGSSWRRGTRWSFGLADAEIEQIEARYGFRFPADHRLFLRTLHATTPRMIICRS
jgi:hypothetical protein